MYNRWSIGSINELTKLSSHGSNSSVVLCSFSNTLRNTHNTHYIIFCVSSRRSIHKQISNFVPLRTESGVSFTRRELCKISFTKFLSFGPMHISMRVILNV